MNKFNIKLTLLWGLCLFSVISLKVKGQCGTTISAFPYTENFETSQGGWTSGGTLNDWAWGTPSKTVITGAGSGSKCWVTGGLTGSFYNYGERSYVKSPCFDFSSLQYPMIDFLIFWDSEHTYDGLVLQSSINGGTTWVNVGAYGDSVNCMNQNWYNTKTVTNLNNLATVKNGWTGNNLATSGSCQGGSGSLRWVEARHCLSGLGGQSSVMFRFAFGAGTTCNDFDGIAFDSIGIGESPLITASFNTICLSGRKVSFTGVTSECPNSFSWNFGDPASGASNTASTVNTTHTFSAPGSYTVSFTASGPCNAPATYTSIVNVLGVTDSVHHVSCFGQNNGSINLNVTGGTSPYTFNWGNGIITQNRTGLSNGTYMVTVSDPQGCSIIDTIAVTQPQLLVVTDSTSNTACAGAGNSGSITLTVTGGTTAYSYNWGGGIITQNRTGLGAGTYSVTVSDANGCSATTQASISAPLPLSATATPTNVLCFAAANGSITVTVIGGTSPYAYNWAGGITTQNRTGLAPGSYTVTVTDHGRCTATATATITQPAAAVSVNLVSTNATCTIGGTITTTATGGAGGYTYNWGAGIATQNRNGLGAGTFTVTVTDLNNCTATASATLTSASTIQVTAIPTGVSCNGGNNGAINVTASGGTGSYTYNWGLGVTTQNRTNLTSGVYTITVTDNSSCTAAASATVTQPAVLTDTALAGNISCFGGSDGTITVTDTGGTTPYSYNWGNGVTTQNRTGLATGTYTVTVTDNKGCTATASATISQPQQLLVSDSVGNVLCFGGNTGVILAKVTGGNNPYHYNWGSGLTINSVNTGLTAGAYSVTVTDSKGCTATVSSTITQPGAILISPVATTTACDSPTGTIVLSIIGGIGNYSYRWSNGATNQNINSLVSNVYSVTVTDGNGCTASASAIVSQTVGPQITFVSTPVSCNGATDGTINSNVTGGTPGYSYVWSNADISSAISGLGAGVYTVTVHDAHNCSAVASDFLSNPTPVVVSLSPTNAKCYGDSDGSISSSVTGGTPSYIYQWSNGDSTANISGLVINSYSVTVSDQRLCSATSSVSITQPVQISVSTITDSATCGEPNGAAQLNVSGGNKPYTFAWLPAVSDSSSAVGLSTAHYRVTITDSTGCSFMDTFSIGGKNTIIQRPDLGVDTFICPGNETIILNAGVFQNYFWQDSSSQQHFTVRDSGTYWVIVTDSNGCKSSDSIVVAEKCNTKFVVPSAFSPNGDGRNDVFLPRYIDTPVKYSIHIYNRWGEMVFETNNITSGWDGNFKGKAQPSGTFVYYIQYTFTGEKQQGLQGAFELLR